MKNDITYEYRKFLNRPNLIVRDFEMGECTYDVLMKELKKPFNGRAYHTTDTNQFFYDWNGKRYELNWLGKSETVEEKDIAELKKQIKEIQGGNNENEKKIADLKKTVDGIKGITPEQEDALKSISDINNKVEAATQAAENATQAAENAQDVAEELKGQLDNLDSFLTKKDAEKTYQPKGDYAEKDHNHDDVYSKLNHTHDQYLTEHQSLEGYVTEDNMKEILKDYLTGSEGIDVSELADALKDYLTGSDIADFVTKDVVKKMIEDSLGGSDEPIVIPTYIGSTYVNIDGAGSENVNVVEVKLGNNEFIQNIGEITNDTHIDDSDERNGLVTMSQVIELIKKKSNEVETVDYIYINGYQDESNPTDIAIYNPYPIVIDNETNECEIIVHVSPENEGYEDGGYFGVYFGYDITEVYEVVAKQYLPKPVDDFVIKEMMDNPRANTKKYGDIIYNSKVKKVDNPYYGNDTNVSLWKLIIKKK